MCPKDGFCEQMTLKIVEQQLKKVISFVKTRSRNDLRAQIVTLIIMDCDKCTVA